MATYNRAQFIGSAIESVLKQTHTDLDLQIIDDGSEDETPAVVAPFLSDPRVHYVRQRNRGQATATNAGIARGRSEYVAFLDSDDEWTPNKLEMQVRQFEACRDLDLSYGSVDLIDESGAVIGERIGPFYEGHVTGPLLRANFIPYGSVLLRRSCLDDVGVFDPDLVTGLDYDLWLRMSTRFRFGYVDQKMLRYRIWPGQVTAEHKLKMYPNGIAIMERFVRQYPGAATRAEIREAWAYTYAGYAGATLAATRDWAMAARFSLVSIGQQPFRMSGWKCLAKAALVATRIR